MIKKISSKKELYALILDVSDVQEGICPITDRGWSLQLLMRKHTKGHTVPAHTHKRIRKTTQQLQEGIVVISGSLKTTIFDSVGKRIGTYPVLAGQCLLFVSGGHAVEVTKGARMYEFKNGPYVEDKVAL